MDKFVLSENFLSKYKSREAPFGFNGLGELVYMRTYSRIKKNGENEMWWETVCRVVEGTYNIQKQWIDQHHLGWNPWQAQKSAQEMYERIFNIKFLPPGRGLWSMGTSIIEEKGLYAALNNCAFVSTESLKDDMARPFTFLMDASMLGVGVGFDTKGAGKVVVKGANYERSTEIYEIPDNREGWVISVKLLIESYLLGMAPIEFDYSKIRGEGEPIRGFGGISTGPQPLKDAHDSVRQVLEYNVGSPITETTIVNIMNLIGKCVVAGNVRRTAEIVFGDPKSEEYLDLKNYKKNPGREGYGWTSNNSVFAEIGMDYSEAVKRININGEPGFAWMENAKNYGRMCLPQDGKDHRAKGFNPCGEQVLESYELCCLVETFPDNHDSLEDYLRTLKYAYLYAKTVTLGKTHWAETNRVLLRNRRIGTSMSGIAQFVSHRGVDELQRWCSSGYSELQRWDELYSDWLVVPRSIRLSSVKPSGTVSLLAGATPGIHYPESRFYIRRVRLSKNSSLLGPLKNAGYNIEPAFGSEDSTIVVEIPVDIGEGIRTLNQVSMWEQLSLAAFMQKYWADNAVSCTVTFKPEESQDIVNALNYYQYQLKDVSFLPKTEVGAYRQMPYEEITEEEYHEMMSKLRKLDFRGVQGNEALGEKFCTSDRCELAATTTPS
jgi:ribonucleoside-triphosphate reductase (thioredoxin)